MDCNEKLSAIALNNLAHFIKILFDDSFCEDAECVNCPFYKKVKGKIEDEDCVYLCDFLFQIKERL